MVEGFRIPYLFINFETLFSLMKRLYYVFKEYKRSIKGIPIHYLGFWRQRIQLFQQDSSVSLILMASITLYNLSITLKCSTQRLIYDCFVFDLLYLCIYPYPVLYLH